MSTRRRGVAVTPMETRRDVIVQAAVLAEELGYEVFSVSEGWGLDSTLVLAEIALKTRQIRLVAGVLSVWSRTPAALAMTAATLHQLSGGRFVLGLGPSTRAGGDDSLDSPTGQRPIRLGQPPVPDLPIWIAAMGSRTVKVVAELADGWVPLYVSRARLTAWIDELATARQLTSPCRARLTVAPGPTVVVDADPHAARRAAAANTAWYLCAMGDVYSRLVADQGYGAELEVIRAANPRPRPHDGVIPPSAEVVLDQFAVYGTPSQVRDRLAAWDSAVDIVMTVFPSGLPWDNIEAALRAAAP